MKTENITAEEFYNDELTPLQNMVKFAKLKVTEALRCANDKAEMKLLIDEENDIIEEANIDKDTILNAYDLTQIK